MSYTEDGVASNQFVCSEEKANVFLIGDSIRQGYCATVKSVLYPDANVFYIEDNCRSTQYVITSLYGWYKNFNAPEKVNVVHFNCGHWDIAHWQGIGDSLTSKAEYVKNIALIIAQLRKLFVNAKIMFATTTPMNPNRMVGENPRTNEEIDEYNLLAVKTCEENGVVVNDLNQFCRHWGSEKYADYCHFTAEGKVCMGEEVAKQIKKFLEV